MPNVPDSPSTTRASSQPKFWNERFEAYDRLFGTSPDPFIADALSVLSADAHVLDVGGGDGRNTLPLAAAHGFGLTVLDFAPAALDTAAAYANKHNVSFAALHADVRTWTPRRPYDAAVVAFVQLLPHERSRLYTTLRDTVRPGGHIIGLWFRTALPSRNTIVSGHQNPIGTCRSQPYRLHSPAIRSTAAHRWIAMWSKDLCCVARLHWPIFMCNARPSSPGPLHCK